MKILWLSHIVPLEEFKRRGFTLLQVDKTLDYFLLSKQSDLFNIFLRQQDK